VTKKKFMRYLAEGRVVIMLERDIALIDSLCGQPAEHGCLEFKQERGFNIVAIVMGSSAL